MTVLPVMLVAGSYVYSDPSALADRVEHRLRLHGVTATLFSTVMVGAASTRSPPCFIAVVDLFFFGLGFGRVLQLAHARSWGLDLRKSVVVDQARYAEVLAAIVVGVFLFVLQTRVLRGQPSWIGYALDIVWLTALLSASSSGRRALLLHHRVASTRLVPGAVFTVAGLVALRLVSSLLLTHWLNWYSTHVRRVRHRHRALLLDHPRSGRS